MIILLNHLDRKIVVVCTLCAYATAEQLTKRHALVGLTKKYSIKLLYADKVAFQIRRVQAHKVFEERDPNLDKKKI